MFGASMYPNGVFRRTPPANGRLPLVWHELQSPARARYSPRGIGVVRSSADVQTLTPINPINTTAVRKVVKTIKTESTAKPLVRVQRSFRSPCVERSTES